MKKNGRGLITGSLPAFAWREEENHENTVGIAGLLAEM
jgi:hypothetical protein